MPAEDAPTWHRDVEPLVQRHCQQCHRPGESAPFPLLTWEQARTVGADIVALTDCGDMPPWSASGPAGRFVGDRRLTEREKAAFESWFDAGMPRGDPASAPAPIDWPTGWQETPDHVAAMRDAYPVAADGPDEYVWFVIPSGLARGGLLSGVELRPEPADVVHHMLAYSDSSGAARELDDADERPGYRRFGDPGFAPDTTLAAWAPGASRHALPSGYARPIEAGSDVVVQVHFVKRGRPVEFRLQVGMTFADDHVRRHVVSFALRKSTIEIPAGAARHVEEHTEPVPLTVELLAVSPHMHNLGRRIELGAVSPTGLDIPLLRIDDWDFNWQMQYVYPRPVRIESGSSLRLRGVFDNSASNSLNPNPTPRTVRWGPDASDEMLLVLLDLAIPEDPFLEREDIRRYLRLRSR